MPKYIFALHDGAKTVPNFACELPDLSAARQEAVRALTEVARDELPNDGDRLGMWVSVQDEWGRKLLTASLEFEVHGPEPASSDSHRQ